MLFNCRAEEKVFFQNFSYYKKCNSRSVPNMRAHCKVDLAYNLQNLLIPLLTNTLGIKNYRKNIATQYSHYVICNKVHRHCKQVHHLDSFAKVLLLSFYNLHRMYQHDVLHFVVTVVSVKNEILLLLIGEN